MARTLAQVATNRVFEALNPEGKHFLTSRILTSALNPYAQHLINVHALIAFGVLPHIKAVAAAQMMIEDLEAGLYEGIHTIVVDSSGNTAHAVARLAAAFGMEVKLVLSADVPESKRGILAALSTAEIINVPKGYSVSERAKEEAQKPGHWHINQYSHLGNMRGHELYTGPEVARVLGNNIGVIAIAMGSGGTAAGVGRFLKTRPDYKDAIVLGVRPSPDEQVPGARNARRMAEVVTLPWRDVVDAVVELPRKESFLATRKLWGVVEPQPGPTSGLAYAGLMHYLDSLDDACLKNLYGKNAAFICPDDGRFYSDLMISELDTGQGVL